MAYQFLDVKNSLDMNAHFEEITGTPWYRDAVHENFSDAEYRRRYAVLRKKMFERGIDCVIAPGSGSNWSYGAGMTWLSGLTYHAGLAQYVVFPRKGDPMLICAEGGAHLEAIRRAVVIKDVRSSRGGQYAPVIVERINELGLQNGRIGFLDSMPRRAGDVMPFNHFRDLHERLPNATIEMLVGLLHELLYVKSAEELAAIKRCGELLDLVFDMMLKTARPGVTEREVLAAAAEAAIAEGGEVEFLIIGSTSSHSPAMPFGNIRPSGRVLQKGDVIADELAVGVQGYTAQMGNPICVGEPAPSVRRFWEEIVQPGFDRLAKCMRPGVTLEEIQQTGRFYRDRGCQGRPLLLHGMDMITSGPQVGVGKIIANEYERTLKPGMTLMLEPDAITADGLLGLFVGRTFVITDEGGYSVTKFPVQLPVV